mgnify:CR=1 FL=1
MELAGCRMNRRAESTGCGAGVDRVGGSRFGEILLLLAYVLIFPQAGSSEGSVNSGTLITRIALGSCADQDKPQPIWEAVVAQSPQLFLFLGDNVYADTADMGVMRACYKKLGGIPGYQKLLKTCPVIAVWDDHDYGVNDGGSEFPAKAEAEKVFHEFFQTPADSPSLHRPGIYDARYFDGGEGKRLQILLLDTRYFRGPLVAFPEKSTHGPYDRNRDPSATVLGEDQWKWLGEELKKPADIRLILSSIQVLPQDHHWELWENFPLERQRLLRLLAESKTGPVVFFSGDRHMGEIMKLATTDPDSPGFPVFEMTTSGLTNAGGGKNGEPNRHRVSPKNFQSRNFGLVEIDWEALRVTLELRDVDGKVVDRFLADLRAPQ